MKSRLLNGILIFTSLFGYLEWGGNNATFLWQAEAEIVRLLFTDPPNAIHPFTIIPILGQLLLLLSLFQKTPGKAITFTGMACLGLLLFFMLFIGFISMNYKIIMSVLPYTITCILVIRYHLNPTK